MDSLTLAGLMKSDPYINERFLGVYASDMIPDSVPEENIIIVNLDPSYKRGSHWIVLHYLQNNKVEHFDSIGKKPTKYIHNLLISKKLTYIYNTKRLQSYDSYTCGLFCLYYSFYSCRFYSFQNIINKFGDNLIENERLAIEFSLKNFRIL